MLILICLEGEGENNLYSSPKNVPLETSVHTWDLVSVVSAIFPAIKSQSAFNTTQVILWPFEQIL